MVVADLEAFAPLATSHFALTGGVAGIFERKGGGGGGSHSVKQRILTSFRQLIINVCLLKKGLQRGVTDT